MKKQEIEKIKLAVNNLDVNFKLKRKAAGIKLLKRIIITGLLLMAWTFTMLLVIIIIEDIETGVKIFLEVNNMIYELYIILCGIGIFLFLIEYVFKNKKKCVDEIIIKDPTNNKYK